MENPSAAAQHGAHKTLLDALARASGLPLEQVAGQLGNPPKPGMGDYAFPCFMYGKQFKLAPPTAAAQLAEKLQADAQFGAVAAAEAAGPFLNIRLKPGVLPASVICAIADARNTYGESKLGAGQSIVVDYSAPNIAKPFHVGHLMSTIIGASLVRIFRALGYTVIGVNHLGDWGVQCGFQFLAWEEEKKKGVDPSKELAARGLDYLADLYVEINQRAKADATGELDRQARALFKRLEDGDAELKALWEKLRNETLAYLQKSYDRLNVRFDSTAGEGFYEPLLKPLLQELKATGIAVESEGALVIPMDDGAPKIGKDGKPAHKPPFILLKEDAATIYGTRDLAAALYRKKEYDFAKNLYVVDVRQSLHFQQLFKALEKMSKPWAKDCVHVSFGLMKTKDGDTMTTRGGRMVPLNELLDKMVDVVRKIVVENNPELPPEKAGQVAEAVGVGAIVFWIQSRRRASDFNFDWAQATDPRGDTGPYLQYTHARARSILRKAGTPREQYAQADLKLLIEPEESAVSKALENFPRAVRQAAADYEPSLVSSYLLELASAFGNFLNKHRVLDSAPELRNARLMLVETVAQVLNKGLTLLGVVAPEEM